MSMADDRELERFLKRQDPLSRAYQELKDEQPSPALDQAVMQRAREALRSQPHERRMRIHGWTALAAIAATVVLSFALVMRIVLEPELQRESVPYAPAGQPERGLTAPQALEDHAAPVAESAPAFAVPSTSAPAASSIEKRRPAIEAEIRSTAEQAPAVAEPSLAEHAAAPFEDARAVAAPSARSGREEAPAAAALERKQPPKPPEEWLEEIDRLRAAGDTTAADRELDLFKQAYPGYLEQRASPADR
jgi:hypothetical protein